MTVASILDIYTESDFILSLIVLLMNRMLLIPSEMLLCVIASIHGLWRAPASAPKPNHQSCCLAILVSLHSYSFTPISSANRFPLKPVTHRQTKHQNRLLVRLLLQNALNSSLTMSIFFIYLKLAIFQIFKNISHRHRVLHFDAVIAVQ